MTWPHFSFNVDLGQILVTGALTAVGWGLRKIYKSAVHAVGRVTQFVDGVHENGALLEATTAVVDDHSQIMIRKGFTDGPVVVLNRRKRSTDPAVFTKDNVS